MIVAIGVTVVVAILLIALIINRSFKIGLVAVPNSRSAHSTTTPCGAGIGFISAFLIGAAVSGSQVFYEHYLVGFAVIMVFALGVFDDLKHTSSKAKFFVIIVVSLLLIIDGLEISTVGTYLGSEVVLGVFAIPVTLFAVVGFTNALNLLDGLDGLAGLVSLVILAGLAFVGYQHGDLFIIYSALLLMAALTSFLFFNWNPARIFMGDSGSLVVGFLISVLSIKATEYIDPVSILFISAIPILDTVTVMVRRKKNGVSMVAADRNHVHHILNQRFNGNVKLTVISLATVQLAFTIIGVFITSKLDQAISLPLFLMSLFGFYLVVERLASKSKACVYE